MLLINPYRFSSDFPEDTDATAYIAAVESADGQSLEPAVKTALNNFIGGCKADGIWTALKASCILAGARTLSGALVPLVGAAPTSINFVSGDYNRKTGLVGNSTTKYLNSNRAADADPQNNASLAVWVSTPATAINLYYLGAIKTTPTPAVYSQISTNVGFAIRNTGIAPNSNRTGTGLAGVSRTASNSYNWRWAGATGTSTSSNSTGTYSGNLFVYGGNINGAIANRSNGRLAFYSIGESLNLALLDTRVSTLMTDIAAAIPRAPVSDVDALAYIAAVETADAQTLEDSVKFAYEDFIVGCKTDGIWSAIKASCILAGARTLSGALVPLVGTASTSFNFVSGDYNRETGLKGDGATKYINPNRNNNADPQNSKHLAVYATQLQVGNGWYLGGSQTSAGHSFIYFASIMRMAINANSAGNLGFTHAVGLLGCNRSNATTIQGRTNKATQGNGSSTIALGSQTPANFTPHLFRRHPGDNYGNSRLSFYSIGESIDLALLDTRVSNLMTALAAAI